MIGGHVAVSTADKNKEEGLTMHCRPRHALICLPLLLFLFLPACGNYDFTVNDKVVYRPAPLFEDFDIPDAALRDCVTRAIAADRVTSASQLYNLSCTKAGISTLNGLSTFSEIEHLRLSGNDIEDISEIASLTTLQELHLDNNRVVKPAPLYQLPALQLLDLSGNSSLLCPTAGSLLRLDSVILPAHCR